MLKQRFPSTAEEDFGVFLKRMRLHYRTRISEVMEPLDHYFPEWDRFTYSRLESGRRAPKFQELLPLYRALVLGCGIIFRPDDRRDYVELARRKIAETGGHRDRKRPDGDWRLLAVQLAEVDQDALTVERESAAHEPPLQRASSVPLPMDTRHIVGREAWLAEMLAHSQSEVSKKLVIVQGPVGSGKSSGMAQIVHALLEQDSPPVISVFQGLRPGAPMQPEEFLEQVMGTLQAELKVPPYGEEALAQTETVDSRIERVLHLLVECSERVVVVIDNGEVLLHANGKLNGSWSTFLERFLHYQHRAMIYLLTREWPGWSGKDQAFVEETILPPLSPAAGARLLGNMGSEFQHVPLALLEQLSERCGGNPFLLECCASLARKPLVTFSWTQEGSPTYATGSGVEQALRRMLEAPAVLSSDLALEKRSLLAEVIRSHVSQDTQELLQILAVAAVPLATPLLHSMCQNPRLAVADLFHASLARMLGAERIQLLPVVTEAVIQHLSTSEIESAERIVINAYYEWLEGNFFSEQEKSQVITELAVLLLKHRQLLDAAQLLIRYGWLGFTYGHGTRLCRLAQEALRQPGWRETTAESEIGGWLLHCYFAPVLGQQIDIEARAQDARRLLALAQEKGVHLTARTWTRLLHFVWLHLMNARRFEEAQAILTESRDRLETLAQVEDDPEVITTLNAMYGRLLGTWSDELEEQKNYREALTLRQQAAATLQQCVESMQALAEITPHWQMKQSNLKYRLARDLTNLGYHLGRLGDYERALEVLEQSIILKKAGYLESGSLAAALGEKAQMKAHLGRFQEALDFDQQARAEVERLAATGNSFARDERWAYQVDQACLYLRLGRVEEAERLLHEAEDHITEERREYALKAQRALAEIQAWRAASPGYQLDWRWSARYHAAIAYDPFKWLAPAGPFTSEEQAEWNRLADCEEQEDAQLRRSALMSGATDRELAAALSEVRQPRLHYPAIPIDDLKQRQAALGELTAEVREQEPNALVRRFYLDAIEEQLCYLRMIEATFEGDGATFSACNRQLHAEPSPAEMESAFTYLTRLIRHGLQYPDTHLLSVRLIEYLKRLSAPIDLRALPPPQTGSASRQASAPVNGQLIAPEIVRRFFEAVLDKYGFEGWSVVLDHSTNDARIEPNVREVILPADQSIPVSRIRTLLSHEIESHVFRNVAGERSPLTLLGLGTKGSLLTDEGLAQYFDQQTALAQGTPMDESAIGFWIGTLATGLASGVLTPPQTFTSLVGVFELVFALNRILKGIDVDVSLGLARGKTLALQRCLRTFRGVPDLRVAGHAYVKDAIYLRGYRAVAEKVRVDPTALTRLMVGIVALEQLHDLEELGIVSPPQAPLWLARDPQIETSILSFQHTDNYLETTP